MAGRASGDEGRGLLISLDEVAPSRMVGVYASVIFPCTTKSRRRFLLALAHPDSSGERAIKRLCVSVCMLTLNLPDVGCSLWWRWSFTGRFTGSRDVAVGGRFAAAAA